MELILYRLSTVDCTDSSAPTYPVSFDSRYAECENPFTFYTGIILQKMKKKPRQNRGFFVVLANSQ